MLCNVQMNTTNSQRDDLLKKAQEIAAERGWVWREPVEITSAAYQGDAVWVVRTNTAMRSPSVRILFRQSDHQVLHAGYLPR